MDKKIHDLVMSGDRLTLDKPGDPMRDVELSQKMTAWLRQRTEGNEPSVQACMYTAAWIDVLCAHILKLDSELDDLHRQIQYDK